MGHGSGCLVCRSVPARPRRAGTCEDSLIRYTTPVTHCSWSAGCKPRIGSPILRRSPAGGNTLASARPSRLPQVTGRFQTDTIGRHECQLEPRSARSTRCSRSSTCLKTNGNASYTHHYKVGTHTPPRRSIPAALPTLLAVQRSPSPCTRSRSDVFGGSRRISYTPPRLVTLRSDAGPSSETGSRRGDQGRRHRSVGERIVLCPPVTGVAAGLGAHRGEDGCGKQGWRVEQDQEGGGSGDDGGSVAGSVVDELFFSTRRAVEPSGTRDTGDNG